jgi:GDP-L-fucose synthase
MIDPFATKGEGLEFYKDKKVAVTGATGLIGSYAVKLLKEAGATVRAVVHERMDNDFTEMADDIWEHNLLTQGETEDAIADVEIVIGCAGITGGVNLPKIDPVSYVGPASVIAMNTIHACWKFKVKRFGYLSSTTVYAPSDRAVREEDSELPGDLYPLYRGIGQSKRFLEKLCRYYHETTGLGVGVVRPAGAYGRFDNFDEKTSHVMPGMIERARKPDEENKFEVWGDGHDVRDFVHAQDVARGLLLATALRPDATPFNIASGVGVTTGTLAETVLRALGSKKEVTFDPSKPTALKTRLVDISRARDVLKFEPQISLYDGIKDVIAWREEDSK